MPEWISIKAKFDSSCIECLNEIYTGDQILWLRGTGTKHKECPEEIQKNHEVEVEEDYSNWKDPSVYSYTEVQKIAKCQKCGGIFSKDKFLRGTETGFRAVCENCFK